VAGEKGPLGPSSKSLLFLFTAAFAWLGGLFLVRFTNSFKGRTHGFDATLLALEGVRLFRVRKADDLRFSGDIALMCVLTRHISSAYEHSNPLFTFLVYAYTMPSNQSKRVLF